MHAEIGTSEQELVNNTFILYDGCDGKYDSDDDDSEGHLNGDEREMKPDNEIASGKLRISNSKLFQQLGYCTIDLGCD